MLARTFRTAPQLKIKEREYGALTTVLAMLESGEIKAEQFDMSFVARRCGTVGCIMGWCQFTSKDNSMFNDYALADVCRHTSPPLRRLFMFGDARRYEVNISQAAQGLRNYLTYGEPCWNDVLNKQFDAD